MAIIDEIKDSFKKGSTLTKLIYINIGVWLSVQVIHIISFLFTIPDAVAAIIPWFAVPADLSNLVTRPWTVFTYMFLHESFLHILFNMLWLFWFGRIFLMYLDQKKLLSVYLLGGLTGAAFYILAFNLFPVFYTVVDRSMALGASASVLAIVIAISVYVPNYAIYLLLLGPVKIKYIAMITVALDIISIPSSNSGGHIAHLGGAFFGFIYISQLTKGKDIAKGFNSFMDGVFTLFKPEKKLKVTHKKPKSDLEYNEEKIQKQAEIDRILDKIASGGYESLTNAEKETLFRMGKEN